MSKRLHYGPRYGEAPDSLAASLRSIRVRSGLTLREVEARTGISNAFVSQLETGKGGNPSPHALRKLAECYSVSYVALMEAAGYLP